MLGWYTGVVLVGLYKAEVCGLTSVETIVAIELQDSILHHIGIIGIGPTEVEQLVGGECGVVIENPDQLLDRVVEVQADAVVA